MDESADAAEDRAAAVRVEPAGAVEAIVDTLAGAA